MQPHVLASAVALALTGAGCTARIQPPASPDQPTTAYVLDHGTTASLVLPAGEKAVRYAHGDWRYYAQGHRGPSGATHALLWPSAGTLGRKPLGDVSSSEAVRVAVGVDVDEIYPVDVSRDRAETLSADLAAAHRAGKPHTFNPQAGLHFARVEHGYHFFNNSNHAVARWLERLACEITGPVVLSNWQLADPTASE
jgi:hypothetical protein